MTKYDTINPSHPSWVRGLKSSTVWDRPAPGEVAPLVGAWIEIVRDGDILQISDVAPLVGAWIEIPVALDEENLHIRSHPSWVRGLKLVDAVDFTLLLAFVAPLVGAWIEMTATHVNAHVRCGRTPRGCVD